MLARGVYPLYRIAGVAATGGIYAAPTNQTIMFALPLGRGRGMPRPYRAVVFYCPVGRGDPTPPWRLPVISHYRCGGNGRHICRPYSLTRDFRVAAPKNLPYQKCAACAAHRVSDCIKPELTPAVLRLPKALGCPQSSGSARRLWRSARRAGRSGRRFPGRWSGRC